jgi:hypothetical protein
LPVAAGMIPLLNSTLYHGHEIHEFWFHQFILVFILPISILALFTGFRCHKNLLPVVIAGLGLGLLVLTALFAEYLIKQHIIPHSGEMALTVTGGIVHALGHILNVIASRRIHSTCAHELRT